MVVNYRVASPEDSNDIYEFALKAIADASLPKFAQDAGTKLRERLDTEESVVLIAVDSTNDIVGYVELDLRRVSETNAVFIKGIYVLPEQRRKGIGAKLMEMTKSEFTKNGEKIRVEAFTSEGKQFWESMNFSVARYVMELND